jgi:hypothetical protein
MSLAIPDPAAVTLLRFSVLVIVAGAVGAAQLNEVPSGQTARNCTLAVGSGSSVSGASKSRVLNTSSVPCTVEPSEHKCGTAQNAEAVSSKNSDRSADADVENAKAAVRAASATAQRRRADGGHVVAETEGGLGTLLHLPGVELGEDPRARRAEVGRSFSRPTSRVSVRAAWRRVYPKSQNRFINAKVARL